MTPTLTTAQLGLILTALNDREGVLATNYEAARRANSDARVAAISAEMRDVRALADLIGDQLIVAKRLRERLCTPMTVGEAAIAASTVR